MPLPVVRNFDLYNTTFYWNGYTGVPTLSTELEVAKAYYIAQYSSNPIGSLVDFFASLAGQITPNPCFTVPLTINTMPYLWARFWWDEAMFYTLNFVTSAISVTYPNIYQTLSESIGSLYFISRVNNLLNEQTVPYNTLIDRLLLPAVSLNVQSFYQTANSLFVSNISAIGPIGTDISPNNSNLIMADTDLNRMITANLGLTAAINTLYSSLSSFLSFNTIEIGNLIVPISWTTTLLYESQTNTITVDFKNRNINSSNQLELETLMYTEE